MPRFRSIRSILVLAALAAAGTAGGALPATSAGQAAPTPPATTTTPTPPAAPTTPVPSTAPYVPVEKALYRDGPAGKFLLAGQWLLRLDPANAGLTGRFMDQTDTAGWSPITVPNAWNATDQSDASFAGSIAWYRKDFELPSNSKKLTWIVRFESVSYRSKVWLNGHVLGTNRGAYLPFEFRLPNGYLKRGGVNHLVIRTDNKRFPTDFPPSGLSVTGTPTGGWWNYGGLLREVYLRRVDHVDWSKVVIRPILPCAACAASVQYQIVLRNDGPGPVNVHLTGRYGAQKIDFGKVTIGAARFASFTKSIRIAKPHLWSPVDPYLYNATLDVTGAHGNLAHYYFASGVRSIKVVDGHLLLNGLPLHFRGVGLHEDDPLLGAAINNQIRDKALQEVKDLGATLIRSHYPLHPYTYEQADRLGIMLWSEIPVYAIKTKYLRQRLVRQLATKELSENIAVNQNHPAVIVWSIGNELSSKPGPVQGYYIAHAVHTAHELDPTRPVGLAVAGYTSAGCQSEYDPLDVLGVNEYFGWYPGPNGSIADPSLLSGYLDSVRACYPKKAIVITETGAEANRDGPEEEKGTYQYQVDYAKYHFGIYALKPWLSGAIWWALQEFRVRPGWTGENPHPDPPIHQKGLITFAGVKKPVWPVVQQIYKSTKQYG